MCERLSQSDRALKYVTKIKVELNQNFRRFFLNYKDEATIKIANKFPGVVKSWYPAP